MAQRHPNDDTVTLPPPHADPASPLFVPLPLREAYSELGADFEETAKRQLYTEIPAMRRTVGRQHTVLDHRNNEADFAVALHWLKLDEAARRVARENERRADHERDQRDHTCRLCGRYDGTANNSGLVVSGIPEVWCQQCRDEWGRQELDAHATRKVGDSTVAELIATARKSATP